MTILAQPQSQVKPLATVHYDRSAKQYIVRNGRELGRFPQGEENKVRAQWLAIEHDNPQVCEVARNLVSQGQDEARVIKAARIVIEGRVLEHHLDGDYGRAIVKASAGNRSPLSGLDTYFVSINLIAVCDCQDWLYRRDTGEKTHHCRHTLALRIVAALARREEERRQAEFLSQALMY